MQDVVFNRLTVMRNVALGKPVEIAAANVERIFAERMRDLIHDMLDQEHALRPAEATKRGVRHLVRFAREVANAHMLQKVRIVDVTNGPRIHRAGQIGGVAAVRREHQIGTNDSALFIKADVIFKLERMPLAGDDHVVITIQPHLDAAT